MSEVDILRAALQDIANGDAEARETNFSKNPPAWYVGNMGARARAALMDAEALANGEAAVSAVLAAEAEQRGGYAIHWEVDGDMGYVSGWTRVAADSPEAAEAYFDCYLKPRGYMLMGVKPV